MRNPEEIKRLAYERLEEANILCENEKYDGAFYLAGYSIELILKAKICEHFGVDNLFDFDGNVALPAGVRDVRKALKTHDITALLMLSGLKIKLQDSKANNKILDKTMTRLFHDSGHCLWSEQVRYQQNSQEPENVIELILLLKNKAEGLLQWVEKN